MSLSQPNGRQHGSKILNNPDIILNRRMQKYYLIFDSMQLSKSTAVQEASTSAACSHSATPKVNLNNIIQVTEEHDANPIHEESPTDTTPTVAPKLSKVTRVKSYFKCCRNWWRFVCPPKVSLELQVGQSDFTELVYKLRNKKTYYAPVLPSQVIKRKVLVLDLDETLIHTSFSKPQKYDFQTQVQFNGKNTKIFTVKRFGLQSFLFEMSKIFEIVVFTASQKLYADKVLDLIDPKHRISHRLYREHCIAINKTYYLKNLKLLGRDLSQVIIVDDNNVAGLLHPDNFYRIQAFDGNPKDRQLCRLSAFLNHIKSNSSISPVDGLRKKFEEMEINLQEVVLQVKVEPESHTQGRSLDARMRKYRHKKTNSEVQTLFKNEAEEEGQTTTSDFVKRM